MIGLLPFTKQFGGMVRFGFMRWDAKTSATWTSLDMVDTLGFSTSATGTDLTYGLGLTYDFTSKIAGRLEWQRYVNVGNDNIGKTDIDLLSLSVLFRY